MLSCYVLGALVLNAISVFASPVSSELAKRADDSFGLFVYGQHLGGYQIMYKDGSAYAVGPQVDSESAGFINITFSPASDNSRQLEIAPVNSSVSFNSTLLFGFPTTSTGTTASRKRAVTTSSVSNSTVSNNGTSLGFATESSSSYTTTGWVFYGNTLLLASDDDSLTSSFYVTNTSASYADGALSMGWFSDGETQDSDDLRVTVRRVKPSNAQR